MSGKNYPNEEIYVKSSRPHNIVRRRKNGEPWAEESSVRQSNRKYDCETIKRYTLVEGGDEEETEGDRVRGEEPTEVRL